MWESILLQSAKGFSPSSSTDLCHRPFVLVLKAMVSCAIGISKREVQGH